MRSHSSRNILVRGLPGIDTLSTLVSIQAAFREPLTPSPRNLDGTGAPPPPPPPACISESSTRQIPPQSPPRRLLSFIATLLSFVDLKALASQGLPSLEPSQCIVQPFESIELPITSSVATLYTTNESFTTSLIRRPDPSPRQPPMTP